MIRVWIAALLLAAGLHVPVRAADLVIGLGADVTSMDPHVLNAAPNIFTTASNRMIFFHLDSDRDKTPFAFDKSGKPLDKNPFKDERTYAHEVKPQ